MSRFADDYFSGFDFDTVSGNSRRQPAPAAPAAPEALFDDGPEPAGGPDEALTMAPQPDVMMNDDVQNDGMNQPGMNQPAAQNDRYDVLDDDFEDDFDDYRPGSRLMVEGRLAESYASFRSDSDDFDEFDDDDFGDRPLPARGETAPADDPGEAETARPDRAAAPRRTGLGYSHYDGDYTEDDYAEEFAGIRGLSKASKLPERLQASDKSPRRKDRRDQPERPARAARAERPERRPAAANPAVPAYDEHYDTEYNAADDPDGYYGRATMRDVTYEGVGVPRIFADYFHDDEDYDDYDEYNRLKRKKPIRQKLPAARIKQNLPFSSYGYRRGRVIAAALAILVGVAAAAVGISYSAFFRTKAPLNVNTALTSMQGSVSDTLLKSSVDQQLSAKTVQVIVNGVTSVMSLAECEFQFSTEEDGTERKEWGKSVTGSDVEYMYMTKGSVRFNETKVKDFLHKASGSDGIRMIEPDYKVDIRQNKDTKLYSGTLKITSGSNGYGVDFDVFIAELMRHISADDYSPITAELTNTIAPPVDIDKIYKSVHAVAADAYKVTDGAGNVTYEPETIGVDFDRNAAAQKIEAGGTEWIINLALTIPSITKKALMAETFPDLLATYSTSFNAGNQARASNLALAGDYINGTILEPGDVFSYNKTVGERTKERGFCKATVYSSEGTDEDYGGGICQTSSTLFYCAMKANLELVKRTNHLYTVSYMVDDNGNPNCYGNDATVNWGTADMQFRNSKEYPIKIECITKNGTITFNIWGTWDGYTAEYRYVEKATERYKVIYRRYKEGKKNQAGQLGRTIWTYRVIFYQEDPNVGEREEVERYREFESVYRPLSQVKYVTTPPPGYHFD